MKFYTLLFFFLLVSFNLMGQENEPTNIGNIITDRPDQTESAAIVPINYFQLESGTFVSVNELSSSWGLVTNLLRYGVAKNLELRMVSTLSRNSVFNNSNFEKFHTMGISDLEIGFKYGLVDKNIQLAFLGHVVVPSGTGNFSEEVAAKGFLCFSHGVNNRISFGYNLGISFTNEDNYALLATYSIAIGLTEKLGFFTEIYGDAFLFEDFAFNYNNGFTYLLKPNLQLDFSFGTGITNKSNFYSAGVSWRIPQ